MDRRNYPRLHTRFPAELIAGGKRTADVVTAVDVSITGLQLVCDARTAERIVPGGANGDIARAKPVLLKVVLPLRDGTHVEVTARCVVRAVRLHEDGDHRVGLEYEFFEGRSYAALEAFIDDWVEYPEDGGR